MSEEKDYFIENLAMLISSGMGILSALDAIKAEMGSKKMHRLIEIMKEDIDTGFSLWKALEKTKIFSPQIISLVRLGEESGRLTENLKVIALQQEKQRIFSSKIRSAIMYPVFVISLTVLVGVGVAWFALPNLASAFANLNMKLPLITRILIYLGQFIKESGVIFIPLFLLTLVIIIYFIFIFSRTKFIGQTILFGFPGVKKLIQELELARFGYILGTLLGAGLHIVDALESLSAVAGTQAYQKLYLHLKNSIEDGNSFHQSFTTYRSARKLIPMPIQQMIISSEQSGKLSENLIKIGEAFEAKADISTKDLAIILEPILLVIVWVGVVMVAIAVILPIYTLLSGLHQ
jgi:type II secretory pathway component PulF